MANFTAGTSFSDGVTNDVTAAKLNALVADAVPTVNLSLTSTTGTIATFNSTTGTITNLSTTLAGDFTITQGTGTIGASAITTSKINNAAVTNAKLANPQYTGFRNRIINGDMVIDQRNAGASVTPTSGNYLVDRFATFLTQASKFTVQQNAGAITPPAGFSNYLGVTSSGVTSLGAADYFFFGQYIEGFNFNDMAWGTASASAVTLSFRVYSSLTGTFGGSLQNSAFDRSYPFTYSIPTANTWTTISVTIAGDTSGTWIGATNGIGLRVWFGLGVGTTYSGTAGAWSAGNYLSATGAVSVVGTNGATFYITGVQLEAGSTATDFERRPIGTELALCQRYCSKSYSQGVNPATNTQSGASTMFCSSMITTYMVGGITFPVLMRSVPTVTVYTVGGTPGSISGGDTTTNMSGAQANQIGDRAFSVQNNSGGTFTPVGGLIYAHWFATAEL